MKVQTEADRFIVSQIEYHLRPNETLIAAAYLMPKGKRGGRWGALTARAVFAVLTSTRLFFIKTRVGFPAPLLENHGISSIARRKIRAVSTEDGLRIDLRSGRSLAYDDTGLVERISTQQAFFVKMASLFPRSEAAVRADDGARNGELLHAGIVMCLLCAVAIYFLLK
jgi:hypothetical protein